MKVHELIDLPGNIGIWWMLPDHSFITVLCNVAEGEFEKDQIRLDRTINHVTQWSKVIDKLKLSDADASKGWQSMEHGTVKYDMTDQRYKIYCSQDFCKHRKSYDWDFEKEFDLTRCSLEWVPETCNRVRNFGEDANFDRFYDHYCD